MKNFKDYKGFISDLKILIEKQPEPHNDYIVSFTCLEPILKDNRPSFKRINYIEVCCIDQDDDIIWFNDWYEGYQRSFDIISIQSIVETVDLLNELNNYKELFNEMSQLSREIYETAGLLEDKFRC